MSSAGSPEIRLLSQTLSEPAKLILHKGRPNPISGKNRALYVLKGDATAPEIELELADGVSWPARQASNSSPFHLRVLHFNDLHGWICDIQHEGTRPIFSRMVHKIKEIRTSCSRHQNEGLIVLSAGDDIIGTVFDQLISQAPAGESSHAGYQLYSCAGVDATCLGNHDLDLGVDPICEAIQHDAAFPVLAANLSGPAGLSSRCLPAVIYVIKGLRVGIIGLTTPAEHNLPATEAFEIASPVEVANRLVPKLRPFCDVLIVLSHLGYSLHSNAATVQIAGDVELANALPEGSVDLIVGGHTHNTLNEKGMSASNIVNGIPIVQAGMLGRFLGTVDINVGEQAAVTNARLISTETIPIDEAFEQKHVQPLLHQVMAYFDAPIGVTCRHADLSTEAVRNLFAAGESAFANFICDAMAARCHEAGVPAELAMLDSSSVRAGLPVGRQVSYGDWFNIMPFADTIWILKMTGRQLKTVIEDNALRIDRPGTPHTERGFLHFSEAIRYRIELGPSRASARSVDITYLGRPLDELFDNSFHIACSSFVRVPAEPWESIARQTLPLAKLDLHSLPKQTTGLFMRREIVGYITELGGLTPKSGIRRDGRLVVE